MNARKSENHQAISRSSSASKNVEIFWAEIYRGQLYFRADIYRGRLLTLITGSSSRLLRIRFSADHVLVSGVSFPVHEI